MGVRGARGDRRASRSHRFKCYGRVSYVRILSAGVEASGKLKTRSMANVMPKRYQKAQCLRDETLRHDHF